MRPSFHFFSFSRLLSFFSFVLPLFLFFCILAWIFPLRSVEIDEHNVLRKGIFLDYYLAADFDDPIWESEMSYNHPKFAEYVFALPVLLSSSTTVSETLLEVGFDTDDAWSKPSHWLWDCIPWTKTSRYYETHIFPAECVSNHGEKAQLLLNSRYLTLVFVFILFVLLFSIGKKLSGNALAASIVTIFAFNVSFLFEIITAYRDSIMIPLIFLILFLLIRIVQSRVQQHTFLNISALAVIVGLAVSTKLTAVLSVIFVVCTLILFRRQMKTSYAVLPVLILTFLGISFLTFSVLNPFMWSDPYESFNIFVERRFELMAEAQMETEFQKLDTVLSRFRQVSIELFSKDGWYPPTLISNFLPYFPFDVFLFLTGLYVSSKAALYHPNTSIKVAHQILILWAFIHCLGIILFLNLNWVRYYLLLLLTVTVFQAIGVHGIFLTARYHLRHIFQKK